MEPRSTTGHSIAVSVMAGRTAARRPVNAVLVDVQGVEQVRETSVGRGRVSPCGQGGVQIEGGLFGRWGSKFTLILELSAQQGIVSQIDARRLFRLCEKTKGLFNW